MKILKSLFLLLILSSCNSLVNHRTGTGTIVRDCSGTYVKVEFKGDYLVCNADLLKNKKEGEKIKYTYDLTKICAERNGEIRCMLYHENLGMISIKSLK